MFIFTNLWLILLTTLFLAMFFFLIKRIKSTDYVLRLGINKPSMELITGIVYSGLFVLLQLIMESISSDFSSQIFLIGFVVITITLNYRIAIYSFPIALVYMLFTSAITEATYAVIISFLLLTITYLVINLFLDGWVSRIILYSVGIIIGLVSFLVIGIAFDHDINVETFSTTMLPLLMLPIVETIISYSIKVSVEANILYDSINFVFGRFYRDSIKERAIGERISQDKVKQGIYMLFDINFEVKNLKERKEIMDSVLNDIQTTVSKETVLFSNGGDNYGMFMPTSFQNKIKLSIENNFAKRRKVDDPIKQFEKILDKVSKPYKTTSGGIVRVQVFAGISIYGIQNSSISSLNTGAEFALKINKRRIENRITIFNPSLYRMKVIDLYSVQSLDNAIELDNFANRFNPIINIKTREVAYHFVRQINVSETEFIDDVKTYVRDFGLLDTFERYFAIDALRKANSNKERIIINYSIVRFTENFSFQEFVRQLNELNIDLKKLILLSDAADAADIDDLTDVRREMKGLRELGVKFAVNSFERLKVNFDLFVVSPYTIRDTYKLPYGKTIIVPNVETEEMFTLVAKRGIRFIGGPLLQTNVNINKFNKQSRIYIEELISGKRNNE